MATDYFKYQAMIVDSDINSRMKLKQATGQVPLFADIAHETSLEETLDTLQSGNLHCDVVFISHRFDQGDVKRFIEQAKEIKNGQDAAYILVMDKKPGSNAEVAEYLTNGFDGFLFEPYSVDSLTEITRLAAKVRTERTAAREKVAITLLVTDLISQLDLVAFLKSSGYSVSKSQEKLKDLEEKLHALNPEAFQVYYDIATKMFSELPAPRKNLQVQKYGGVSTRVRQRMEKKITAIAARQKNS